MKLLTGSYHSEPTQHVCQQALWPSLRQFTVCLIQTVRILLTFLIEGIRGSLECCSVFLKVTVGDNSSQRSSCFRYPPRICYLAHAYFDPTPAGMRLLDTTTGRFDSVEDPSKVHYAILSHVWTRPGAPRYPEQTYQDVHQIQRQHAGVDSIVPFFSEKVRGFCERARADGFTLPGPTPVASTKQTMRICLKLSIPCSAGIVMPVAATSSSATSITMGMTIWDMKMLFKGAAGSLEDGRCKSSLRRGPTCFSQANGTLWGRT